MKEGPAPTGGRDSSPPLGDLARRRVAAAVGRSPVGYSRRGIGRAPTVQRSGEGRVGPALRDLQSGGEAWLGRDLDARACRHEVDSEKPTAL